MSNKSIRPEVACAIVEDIARAAKDYQAQGAGVGEIGAAFILSGAELLINALGHVEGLHSIDAILSDFRGKIARIGVQ